MALAGSLQIPPLLGSCRNQGHRKQSKYVTGRGRQHLLANTLSSCASRQDSWTHKLSSSINRPIYRLPIRGHVLKCHSFLLFGQNVAIPSMKAASTALSRSYNSLQGSPITIKLVPALGIVAFTLWGLAPLMRISRNLFLHKSDSSWKKSSTHFVMTSYIQPILLWIGATLICRALDPIILPSEASQLVKQRLLIFTKSLSTVLAFAYCLSCLIQQTQKFFMETSDPTDTRNMGFQFAGKAVYTAVWVAAVSLFMELLGFSTQRWLTAGGLGTVLLTLAGREIFTNFLSSAMIHATRPFVVNEWIQTKIEGCEVSGTVEHVGWWSPTIIRGDDREAVHIPNHKFTVNVVRNLTQKTHWRIKTHLAISHLDVSKINNIVADMRKVLAKNPQVEQQKLHRRVFLDNINPENQSLLVLVSCFVKTSHFEEYLCVKEAILLDLLRVISHHRARLATPIRTIQKFYSETEMDNMPFSDTVFTRSRAAPDRPLLLIEPPYKINGEDKSKPQSRPAQPTPDPKARETSKSSAKVDGNVAESSNTGSKSDPKAEEKVAVKSISKSLSDADNTVLNGDIENPVSSSEFGGEKSGGSSSGSHSKESERLPANQPSKLKPNLEENIVLGVALEGSKRTLPIEDELASPATPAEEKELAAHRRGSTTQAADKDEKES